MPPTSNACTTLKKDVPNLIALHPLDPLTSAEILAARDAVIEHFRPSGDIPRFSFITLLEPPQEPSPLSPSPGAPDKAFPRQAEVVVHLPPTVPHKLLVDLHVPHHRADGQGSQPCSPGQQHGQSDSGVPAAVVSSCSALPPGTLPIYSPRDCADAEAIALADDNVAALLRDRFGIDDVSRVVGDAGSAHLADGVPMPRHRLMNVSLYVKHPDGDPAEHNHYASPLPLTVSVDLVSRSVLKIHGAEEYSARKQEESELQNGASYETPPSHGAGATAANGNSSLLGNGEPGRAADDTTTGANGATPSPSESPRTTVVEEKNPYPTARVDYYDNALKYNAYGPTAVRDGPDALRPLRIAQPAGPSFSLRGRELTWQQWRLRLGFNHREGLVLHDVHFAGRSVLRRAALVEMAVPYADVHAPFPQKCAFDVGDYGLGYCANSLTNGCDCLGEIRYLDAVMADAAGAPYTIANAVCIHEEDAGVLHKHVEYRTGKAFVRRARKLVVSFIATVVNYEYLFYWWLHVDGSLGLDIRLSGELSTNTLSAPERGGAPAHGTLVAPGVNAQLHQHMFCARLDAAVDGARNRVVELNAAPAPGTGADKFGNAFGVEATLLRTEQGARRDCAAGRTWRIENGGVVNRVSGKPVAYKLVPGAAGGGPQPALLTHDDSVVSRRARFAQHALWVTPWTDGQRFPAGEFPTQGVGETDTGLPEWTAGDRDVVDKPLVLWHAFGVTHLPRPEDFPIMPCETVGFALKPDSFFETNPALGICFAADDEAGCH